jgi:hypothetical protein
MGEAEARERIRESYNRGVTFPNFYEVYQALKRYDAVLVELFEKSTEPPLLPSGIHGQEYWDRLEWIAAKLDATSYMVAQEFYRATADRNHESIIRLLQDDIGPKVAPIGSELSFIRRSVNDWLYRCQLSDTFAPQLNPAITGQPMQEEPSNGGTKYFSHEL